MAKFDTLPKAAENPSIWGRTYLYSRSKGETPPQGTAREVTVDNRQCETQVI